MVRKVVGIIYVILMTSIYTIHYYWNSGGLYKYYHFDETFRPYAYRHLVYWIINGIRLMGVSLEWSVLIVTVLCGLGFYLCLQNTILHYKKVSDLKIILMYLLGLLLFQEQHKFYDLLTAFLWSLSLLCMIKQNHLGFAAVFPLVCLNRIETAPFLVVGYFLLYSRKITLYFPLIFIVLWVVLHKYYAGNPGETALIEPVENLWKFVHFPILTLCHFVISGGLLWMVFRNWKNKPMLLCMMFVVLLPTFLILYIIFGQAFEVRVFWEIYPLVASLIVF